MVAIGLAVVGFLGIYAYGAVVQNQAEQLNEQVATGTEEAAVATTLPLTIKQAQCRGAIEQLDRLIKKSEKFSNLDETQSNLAFTAYSTAVRVCTYSEFIEFERETVMPWTAGIDLYNAAQQSGDLVAEETGGSQ